MQPTKSITIVIVALMLTGMVGYFLQPTHEEIDVTTYDYKGDLTPSVLYSQIDDWVEYNPLKNVTGWVKRDGVDIPTTPVANQYLLSPTIIGYDEKNVTITVKPFYVLGAPYLNALSSYANTLTENHVLHSDVGYMIRSVGQMFAYMQTYDYATTWSYTGADGLGHAVTDITYNTIEEKWYPVTRDVIGVDEDGEDIYSAFYVVGDGRSMQEAVSTDTSIGNEILSVKAIDSNTSRTLVEYTPKTTPAEYVDSTKFVEIEDGVIASWSNDQTNGVINVLCTYNTKFVFGNSKISCPVGLPYQYLLCTLDFNHKDFYCRGVTSFANTLSYTVADYRYDMIVDTPIIISSLEHVTLMLENDKDMSIGHTPRPTYAYEPYTNLSTRSYDFYTNFARPLNIENNSSESFFINVPFDVELDPGEVTQRIEITPGMSTQFHFGEWSESEDGEVHKDYDISIEWTNAEGILQLATFHVHIVTMAELNDYPAYYESEKEFMPTKTLNIQSTNTANAKVFIDSTIVSVDPSGILWGNPTMPLQYFFPYQTDTNFRVMFNGFTKYGNSMTINGQTFEIVGGQLKYNYDEIVGYEKDSNGLDDLTRPIYEPRTDFYPVKGMAIDFNRHVDNTGTLHIYVNLVFTELKDAVIELGELATTTHDIKVGNSTVAVSDGYTIYATGTWYWQSGMYDITHTIGDKVGLDLTGNFGLDMSMASLMMVFFIILGCAGVLRFTEMEFVALDWAIIFGSIALLIAVAIL